MKILFLIPPSEGKSKENYFNNEKLTFNFIKPQYIAINANEKDLKCTQERFKEARELNKNIHGENTNHAINRYSGVMYNAINYECMDTNAKKFFEDNFLILSGMYGLLKPLDFIGNYKLPIETKGLYDFWWDILPNAICEIKPDYIVNLLPISYAKLFGLFTNCNRHKKKLQKLLDSQIKVININFINQDQNKISHGVKKIKGEWIRKICEKQILDYENFGGTVTENGNMIEIDIKVKQ